MAAAPPRRPNVIIAMSAAHETEPAAFSADTGRWAPAAHLTLALPQGTPPHAGAVLDLTHGLPSLGTVQLPPSLRRIEDRLSPADAAQPLTTSELWETATSAAATTCHGIVSDGYVNGVATDDFNGTALDGAVSTAMLHTSVAVLYADEDYGGSGSKKYVPKAFILARPYTHGGTYVDVICSAPGFGGVLLSAFLEALQQGALPYTPSARPEHRRTIAALSSLATVLRYYTRFGFSYRTSCDEKAVPLPDWLTRHLETRAAARTLPTTFAEVYGDRDMQTLLRLLHAHGLGVAKHGACAARDISIADIRTHGCDGEGYSMVLCGMPRVPDPADGDEQEPVLAQPPRRPRRSADREVASLTALAEAAAAASPQSSSSAAASSSRRRSSSGGGASHASRGASGSTRRHASAMSDHGGRSSDGSGGSQTQTSRLSTRSSDKTSPAAAADGSGDGSGRATRRRKTGRGQFAET